MVLIKQELTDILIQTFGIDSTIKEFHGGQKDVFVVKLLTGETRVLKIFKHSSERDEREIDIYSEFKGKANIPEIYDEKFIEGKRVVLEKYIEGKTLSEITNDYLGKAGKILDIVEQLIVNMIPFREKGIIHRDIKPDNLILSNQGTLYIIDFGIARNDNLSTITSTGEQPQTPVFASPEQINGKKQLISYRTDFFCIGSMVYYLFYGEFLFGNKNTEIKEAINIANNTEKIIYREDCESLNDFFKNTLSYNPAERARDWNALLDLIH